MKWSRKNKNQIRLDVTKSARVPSPEIHAKARTAFFMPAEKALCIYEAWMQKTISRRYSQLLILDREPSVIAQAYDTLMSWGFLDKNIFMYVGDLYDFVNFSPATYFDTPLQRFKNSAGDGISFGDRLEYMYMDTCNELTWQAINVLQVFRSASRKDVTCACTFTTSRRSSQTFEYAVDCLLGVDRSLQYSRVGRVSLIQTAVERALGGKHYPAFCGSYKETGRNVPMLSLRYEYAKSANWKIPMKSIELGFVQPGARL